MPKNPEKIPSANPASAQPIVLRTQNEGNFSCQMVYTRQASIAAISSHDCNTETDSAKQVVSSTAHH